MAFLRHAGSRPVRGPLHSRALAAAAQVASHHERHLLQRGMRAAPDAWTASRFFSMACPGVAVLCGMSKRSPHSGGASLARTAQAASGSLRRTGVKEPGARFAGVLLAAVLAAACGCCAGSLREALAAVLLAACALVGALLGQNTKVGQMLTGPVSAMVVGVLAAQFYPIPASVLRRIQGTVSSLGLSLLLLSCNLRKVLRGGAGDLLPAFLFGTIGTIAGALSGVALLGQSLHTSCGGAGVAPALLAALTAKNVGSGINFIAVCQALGVPQAFVVSALAVDNLVGLAYFPLASSLMPAAACDGSGDTPPSPSSAEGVRPTWAGALSTLLLGGCFSLLADALSPPGMRPITLTIAIVFTATMFPGSLGRFASCGDLLGWPVLYLFFASAGFAAGKISPSMALASGPLLAWGLVLYTVHLTVVLVAGRLAGLGRAELLVASSANIGGPTTAASMAGAKGFQHLVSPALLVGTFGNGIGTFVGLAVYRLLLWFAS